MQTTVYTFIRKRVYTLTGLVKSISQLHPFGVDMTKTSRRAEGSVVTRQRLKATPSALYAEAILEPSHRKWGSYYFAPLLDTHSAWTVLLARAGVIAPTDGKTLLEAVRELRERGSDAIPEFDSRLEYFYSHVERVLGDRVGEELAGNLSIGRTRPEPLARMVLREHILDVLAAIIELRAVLLTIASREAETVMAQWTHLQVAQPSTVGHYLMGIENALCRDSERLLAAYKTVNRSTLGCGALSGSSYPLDRKLAAQLLGFDGFVNNTIDCVSSGDWLLEAEAALVNMMTTVGRFCADLNMWHTSEFDLIEIGDEYAASSSMLPQKKTPLVFEYVRGYCGAVIGDLAGMQSMLVSTNFQNIKELQASDIAIRSFSQALPMLKVLRGVATTIEFKRVNLLRAAGRGFTTATELAAAIQRTTGYSYRTAHRISASVVRLALDRGLESKDIDSGLVREAATAVIGDETSILAIEDETVRKALDPVTFVAAHNLPGGPAPEALNEALKSARQLVQEHSDQHTQSKSRLNEARLKLARLSDPLLTSVA
jgi:argininosuccinate lyase